MKLPKSLMIFGQKWLISEINDHEAPYMGLCHKRDCKIIINLSFCQKEDLLPTLLHEIFHATIHRVSIDQSLSPELEEIIVDSFSKMLVENFNLHIKK